MVLLPALASPLTLRFYCLHHSIIASFTPSLLVLPSWYPCQHHTFVSGIMVSLPQSKSKHHYHITASFVVSASQHCYWYWQHGIITTGGIMMLVRAFVWQHDCQHQNHGYHFYYSIMVAWLPGWTHTPEVKIIQNLSFKDHNTLPMLKKVQNQSFKTTTTSQSNSGLKLVISRLPHPISDNHPKSLLGPQQPPKVMIHNQQALFW